MIGIDILEVERVDDSEHFISRIANNEEIEYINSTSNKNLKKQKIASLFAVKEAVMKALTLGEGSGVVFKDITLHHYENGKPYVELHGVAKQKLESDFNGKHLEVSVSHTNLCVVAVCVII